MSTRAASLPRSLVGGVLALTLLVLALGGAVLVVKLRPRPTPTTAVERTLQEWRDAVAKDPKSDTAHTGLGLALLDAGDADAARTEFETAVSLNDKNWMAPFQLALLIKGTEPSRAEDLLATASRLAPPTDRVGPMIAQGDLLLEQGDAEGAKRVYQRAIGDSPFIIEAHVGLARAFEALGNDQAALKEYRRAAQFDPSDADIKQAIARLTQGDQS